MMDSVDKPLISVITINYNNASGLEKTIESVISQHYREFEFLVIDGGSTDGSLEVIKRNSSIIRYWVSEKDSGIYAAMNKGISAAKGRFVQFMNSGDAFYDRNAIKTEMENINIHTDVDVFYGDIMILGRGLDKPFLVRQPKEVDAAFFKNNTINHQASMIRRSVLGESLYNTNYKLAGDYIKFVELAIRGRIFRHIDRVLVLYDFDGLSATDDGKKQYNKECNEYWNSQVPAGLDKILNDYKMTKREIDYFLVRQSISLSKFIQRFGEHTLHLRQMLKKRLKK